MKLFFKRLGILAFLVSFGLVFNTVRAEDDPYKLDHGHKGEKPAGKTDRKINYHAHPLIPRQLDCDQRYQIDISIEQPVKSCENFNFCDLRDRLTLIMGERLREIQCPDKPECNHKDVFYTYWHWTCEGNVAVAQVKAYVLCSTKDFPEGHRDGIGNAEYTLDCGVSQTVIDKGENPDFHPLDDGEWIEEKGVQVAARAAKFPLECGSSQLLEMTFREHEEIGKPSDFRKFYDDAESRAKLYYSLYTCLNTKVTSYDDCEKGPFKVLYADWKWDGAEKDVVVTLYFKITCVPKKPH
jgi:hypothetical protein